MNRKVVAIILLILFLMSTVAGILLQIL